MARGLRERRALALFCLAACAALLVGPGARADAADAWQEVRAEARLSGGVAVRETVWRSARSPGAPHDAIGLHRYRGEGPSHAVLLYLPGTNMNGAAAVAQERYNLWLYLAARGVEVYALDYRTHFVGNEDPAETGAHRFMLDWTLDVFAEDIRAAAAFVRRQSGRPEVFVAGFSRGVTFAWAFACTDPGPVAGLVALDGMFKKAERTESFDREAGRQELLESGRYASDVAGRMGWKTRHALMSAVARDPDGPAQREGFETIGDQVGSILYKAWRPGGLANPVDGFSRPQVLAALLDGYDRWWPATQNVEGRSIADHTDDPQTTIDDRWGELTLPVLYFGASGMGAEWVLDGVYSSVKSGSPDVELHVLEGWGHLDVLVGERAESLVFAPIERWIAAHAPEPAPLASLAR